jgi:two-component system OmpR family sensor kinase
VRRPTSIAFRVTALCLLVAAVVVAVAGIVSYPLVASTARDVTKASLARQADVLAGQLEDKALSTRQVRRKLIQVLRAQQIEVVIGIGGALRGANPDAVTAATQAGVLPLTQTGGQGSVSSTERVNGNTLLVEGRPVTNGLAFALVEPVSAGSKTGHQVRRALVLSLIVGLAVAGIAGLLLSRVLARPLRRTAEVARVMGEGRRDARVPVEGPAEVADVAHSVNQLAEALQHSEQRQREFLLSVSHELRTPLTSINGFAETIADGVVTGDDAQAAARTIYGEGLRLERLVTDLLDLARLGADEFKLDVAAVDLVAVLQGAASVWEGRSARAGLQFRLELPASPVVVQTDARRLRQIIDGLADNAVRVTPAGRPLVLALRGGTPGTSEPAALIEVRDGGPGLAPDDYPVAFERGTLHARYEGQRPVGSGIGLALVAGLVTRLGGTIVAGPAPEGGACFRVTLHPKLPASVA